MSDWDNTNSGSLFKNDRKKGKNSPDYTGSCEPCCPHCGENAEFWLSAWIKTSKKGSKFMSLALTAKDAPEESTDSEEFDDIPF